MAILLWACLAGCKPPEEADVKAIVGAVLIDSAGGPPVSNSVILISGQKIAAAGARTNIAIPQGAEEIDGAGKFIIPALIDIYTRAGSEVYSQAAGQKLPAGVLPAGTSAGEARRLIDQFAAGHRYMALLDGLEPAAEEAALDQSRKSPIPVFARVSRLADARRLVDGGVAGLIGMITDTGQIDPTFIAKLRDLRVIWAPALVEVQAAALEIAQRNTGRLAAGGVPIAIAGSPLEREMELLVDAGLSPGEAIVAATRNGALALRKSDELGTLQAGKRADLLMLPKNPIERIRNLAAAGSREMRGGAWLR